MSEHIVAPWTRKQVAALNEFQQSGLMHPFTCGQRDEHPHNAGLLVATRAGWRCPAYGCRYEQDWAHAFMADREALRRMRSGAPLQAEPASTPAEPVCTPEHEIAELRDQLTALQRKLGAARNVELQLRGQVRSAEAELGRLRPALAEALERVRELSAPCMAEPPETVFVHSVPFGPCVVLGAHREHRDKSGATWRELTDEESAQHRAWMEMAQLGQEIEADPQPVSDGFFEGLRQVRAVGDDVPGAA